MLKQIRGITASEVTGSTEIMAWRRQLRLRAAHVAGVLSLHLAIDPFHVTSNKFRFEAMLGMASSAVSLSNLKIGNCNQ